LNTTTAQPGSTLIEIPFPRHSASIWRDLMVVLVGSVLLTVSAKTAIPFHPVPLTLQTLVVVCLGAALGPRLAALTVAAYLLEGAAGLPVFSGTPEKGIGIAYLSGPTGGYLLGFLVAAIVTGWLARRRWDRSVLTMGAAMLIGHLLIYVLGLAWLGTLMGWDKPILEWGLYPFLPGDALKVVIGACLMPGIWRSLRSRGIGT
jgi:biotin transport system substrate-specific component